MSENAEPFGWWTVYKHLDDFVAEKLRNVMPDPSEKPLLDRSEKSPSDMSDLLQTYGGYIAYLRGLEGRLKAEAVALSETYKGGMSVATAGLSGTEKSKEAQVLRDNEIFRQTKRMLIETESLLELLKGWVDAYDIAWQSISRVVTLHMGDVTLQTGRRM